jgi:hypothetical protein
MTNIAVIYHVTDLMGWEIITNEQMFLLESSGLMDNAHIYMNLHYNEDSFYDLKMAYNDRPNIHWVFRHDVVPKDKEVPSAILMKDIADNTSEEIYMLYLHQKGISYLNTQNWHGRPEAETKYWRWLMQYWSIERWQDCIVKLQQGYDRVGCVYCDNWGPYPFLGGTIGWTKASFLRTCTKFRLPSEVGFRSQLHPDFTCHHDTEFWWGANQAKHYSFHQLPENTDLYNFRYKPSLYR